MLLDLRRSLRPVDTFAHQELRLDFLEHSLLCWITHDSASAQRRQGIACGNCLSQLVGPVDCPYLQGCKLTRDYWQHAMEIRLQAPTVSLSMRPTLTNNAYETCVDQIKYLCYCHANMLCKSAGGCNEDAQETGQRRLCMSSDLAIKTGGIMLQSNTLSTQELYNV